MMSLNSVNILLIEDNLAEARLLQELLKGSKLNSFSLVHSKRLKDALERLRKDNFQVVLLDLTLPDSQGLDSLARLIHHAPDLPVVVLTNTNDDDLAIEAVRRGAQDYLVKRHVNTDVLVRSLRYAIERKQAMETLRAVNQALENRVQERTAELMRAQELNQLKSEFVSMISHDFRNPLNTILASTVLLQDHEQKLSQEKKLTLFQRIRTVSKSMAQLLDEVLLIGEADAGQLPYQPAPLEFESFCRQIVDEFQVSIGERHYLVFTASGTVKQATWDENLLRRIFNNLLENAIKYSPEGSLIQFTLIAESNQVQILVQDQGIGIPPEDQKQLFQPFHRAKNVGTIPGTGLGLAIVQRCVQAHGGYMTVQSEVGRGTRFVIIFPWKGKTEASTMNNHDF